MDLLREALFTSSDEENQNVKFCSPSSPSPDSNHFSPPSINFATVDTTVEHWQFEDMDNIPVKKVSSGPMANHSLIITSSGVAYSWGRNEDGQLGVGDTFNRYNPQRLDVEGSRFRDGACGLGHSFLVTTSGDLYCGRDKIRRVNAKMENKR